MNELVLTEKTQNGIIEFANNYTLANNIIVGKDYNIGQAMTNLYLNLLQVSDKNGKPALETCSPVSIQEAIVQCINKKLDVGKTQGYFVPRGGKLCFDSSYFGKIKQARDVAGVRIRSKVVHDGDAIDTFMREDASMIIKHKPDVKCLDKPIIMAYAVAYDIKNNRVDDSDIMTVTEMNKSIIKSPSGGATTKQYPHEMYRRTVSARLAKHYINTSDDTMKVYIDIDGATTEISNSQDLNNFATDYEINLDEEPTVFTPENNENVVTSDILSLEPISEPTVTADIPEGAVEIPYSEYKNNKDAYDMVKDSWNPDKKTVYVIKK